MVKLVMRSIIQGRRRRTIAKTATIRGAKVSVMSWIEVTTWKMLMVRPTAKAAASNGPAIMKGYLNRPEATADTVRDGWLHSGDIGYLGEEGFLFVSDRMKDMIISGGVNVYPRDIEEIVVQHPAVNEAAVFGMPHKKWGETPMATVTLVEPESVSAEELKAWVNGRVSAKFQRLAKVVIMTTIFLAVLLFVVDLGFMWFFKQIGVLKF